MRQEHASELGIDSFDIEYPSCMHLTVASLSTILSPSCHLTPPEVFIPHFTLQLLSCLACALYAALTFARLRCLDVPSDSGDAGGRSDHGATPISVRLKRFADKSLLPRCFS